MARKKLARTGPRFPANFCPMAQQCLRSLSGKLPLSPLSQSIGTSNVILSKNKVADGNQYTLGHSTFSGLAPTAPPNRSLDFSYRLGFLHEINCRRKDQPRRSVEESLNSLNSYGAIGMRSRSKSLDDISGFYYHPSITIPSNIQTLINEEYGKIIAESINATAKQIDEHLDTGYRNKSSKSVCKDKDEYLQYIPVPRITNCEGQVFKQTFPQSIHDSESWILSPESKANFLNQSTDPVTLFTRSFTEEQNHMLASVEVKNATAGDSVSAGGGSPPKGPDTTDEKPNQDRLQLVHDVVTNSLQKLFAQPMDYSVYNPKMVFIDNIRNKTVHGIMSYVQQVAFLRAVGHFKFAYVRFELLNSSISVEESRITVRWRICGISGLRVMLKFWKFRLWNWKEIMQQQETWFDGISYFDVGSDGLIYRHIADKVMEDKSRQVEEIKPGKIALAAKLGLLATLFPQPHVACCNKAETPPQRTYDIDHPGFQPL